VFTFLTSTQLYSLFKLSQSL